MPSDHIQILVDTETLFQPGSANRENRSPLFTMLVQKIPDDLDGFRFSAAIQAPSNNRVHMVFPYVQNDQTDEMKILFHGVPAPNTQNNPIFGDQIYLPGSYVESIIEGYRYGFDRITKRVERIFSPNWWSALGHCRPRFIIRPTVYYAMLIRLIQQPRYCAEPESIGSFLRHQLAKSPTDLNQFIGYEVADLKRFDIPYFYHRPAQRSIFDGFDQEYPNFFAESAVVHLARNMVEFDKSYRDRSVDILRAEIERASRITRKREDSLVSK
ncbi:DUF4135 domain-containing protein [Calidithermus roseus]